MAILDQAEKKTVITEITLGVIAALSLTPISYKQDTEERGAPPTVQMVQNLVSTSVSQPRIALVGNITVVSASKTFQLFSLWGIFK